MRVSGRSISFKETVQNQLPRYKAEDRPIHDEAVVRLLARASWIEDENELVDKINA